MKKYNQEITVTVSVDSIAEKLHSVINPNTPGIDIIVESIIGPALQKGTLTYLFNSLNGYSNEIVFKPGDRVICSQSMGIYGPDDKHSWSQTDQVMTVIEVNEYANEKVLVEYNNGKKMTQDWVKHTNLKIA